MEGTRFLREAQDWGSLQEERELLLLCHFSRVRLCVTP